MPNNSVPNDADKVRLAGKAWDDFLAQLGPDDIYRQIVLEEVFRFLLADDGPANSSSS